VAFPDLLIRVRTLADLLDPKFLRIAWESPQVRDQIEQLAHTTAGIHKVSQKDLAEIKLPIPPREEQCEIVRRVESLFKLADAIEKRVATATSRAEKLTQSILAKAFCGELLPTEAELARRKAREYEPASVLLARVVSNPRPDQKSRRERRFRQSNSRIPAAAR
jgi:type I restriction enzyme, S subunit